MVLINLDIGIKLLFILGITNVIGLLLILFSCRCMGIPKLTNKLFKYNWYQKFYKRHCLYWWFFVTSVILHVTLAFILFGEVR